MGIRDNDVGVLIASPETMRKLNIEWRGEDRAASILSFPQFENPGPVHILGDLALRDDGPGFSDMLLVHGILHLLGWEHDTEKKYVAMEKKTEEIMKACKFSYNSK